MLSKGCTYGIQASVYMAAAGERGFIPVHRISDALGLSKHFLAKVLQELTRHGILESLRGPNGGVALARPPEALTLKQLVVAIDGPALFETCALGLPGCGSERPCPLHDHWKAVRGGIETTLGETTVGELARRMETSGYELDFVLAHNQTKDS